MRVRSKFNKLIHTRIEVLRVCRDHCCDSTVFKVQNSAKQIPTVFFTRIVLCNFYIKQIYQHYLNKVTKKYINIGHDYILITMDCKQRRCWWWRILNRNLNLFTIGKLCFFSKPTKCVLILDNLKKEVLITFPLSIWQKIICFSVYAKVIDFINLLFNLFMHMTFLSYHKSFKWKFMVWL